MAGFRDILDGIQFFVGTLGGVAHAVEQKRQREEDRALRLLQVAREEPGLALTTVPLAPPDSLGGRILGTPRTQQVVDRAFPVVPFGGSGLTVTRRPTLADAPPDILQRVFPGAVDATGAVTPEARQFLTTVPMTPAVSTNIITQLHSDERTAALARKDAASKVATNVNQLAQRAYGEVLKRDFPGRERVIARLEDLATRPDATVEDYRDVVGSIPPEATTVPVPGVGPVALTPAQRVAQVQHEQLREKDFFNAKETLQKDLGAAIANENDPEKRRHFENLSDAVEAVPTGNLGALATIRRDMAIRGPKTARSGAGTGGGGAEANRVLRVEKTLGEHADELNKRRNQDGLSDEQRAKIDANIDTLMGIAMNDPNDAQSLTPQQALRRANQILAESPGVPSAEYDKQSRRATTQARLELSKEALALRKQETADQKEERDLRIAKARDELDRLKTGRLTKKDEIDVVNKLIDQVQSDPIYKKFTDVIAGYQTVRAGFAQAQADPRNSAGDQFIVSGINKMGDPGSTVRVEEFKISAEMAGLLEQAKAWPARLAQGDILPPELRVRFAKLADELFVRWEGTTNHVVRHLYEPLAAGVTLSDGKPLPVSRIYPGVDETTRIPIIQPGQDVPPASTTRRPPRSQEQQSQTLPSGAPAEGYLGPQATPGGGFATVLNTGISDERINGGRETNIPLLVPGQVNVQDLTAGKRPTREQLDIAIRHAQQRIANGETIPSYNSPEEAERAARTESNTRGHVSPRPESPAQRLLRQRGLAAPQ